MKNQPQIIVGVSIIIAAACFISITRSFRVHAQSVGSLSDVENVVSMAWNSDGSVLALSGGLNGQGSIWFYDAATEDITTGIPGIPLYGNLAWSPDNTMIVGESNNEIGTTYRVFRVVDGELVSQFDTGPSHMPVHWSADSRLIMIGGIESVILYNVFDGSIERALQSPDDIPLGGSVSAIAWDTENTRAYGVYPLSHIMVWNSTTTELIKHIEFPTSITFPIALNSAGDQLAVPVGDGQVIIVDPITLKTIKTLQSPNTEPIRDIIWHEDNVHLATCGGDLVIRVWNVDTVSIVDEIATVGALTTREHRDKYVMYCAPVWRPGTNDLIYSLPDGAPTIITISEIPKSQTASD